MALAYENVVARLPALADVAAAWEALAKSHGELDELGRHVGEVVCANLRADAAFPEAGMLGLIETLFSDDPLAGKWPDAFVAAHAYCNACYGHQRLGAGGRSRSLLWHVMTESQLQKALMVRGQSATIWSQYLQAIAMSDGPTLGLILSGVLMHPSQFQLFATFLDAAGPEDWRDPHTWDATTACAALGLSKYWPGYRKGDRLWLLQYDLVGATIHVPTCADADWRSIFLPSMSATAEHGRTILLGPLRKGSPHAEGLPEVVHAHIKMYLGLTPGTVVRGAQLTGPPKLLGENQSW